MFYIFCHYRVKYRDRIDIILSPGIPSKQTSKPKAKRLSIKAPRSARSGDESSLVSSNRSGRSSLQLSESEIEDIQVVDDVEKVYYNSKTISHIPLPCLKGVWSMNGATEQGSLLFNPYNKPLLNPLRIKPLMYDVEFTNYYHSSSEAQLPISHHDKATMAVCERPVEELGGFSSPVNYIGEPKPRNTSRNSIVPVDNSDLDIYFQNHLAAKAERTNTRGSAPKTTSEPRHSPSRGSSSANRQPTHAESRPVYVEDDDAEESEMKDLNDDSSVEDSDVDSTDSIEGGDALQKGSSSSRPSTFFQRQKSNISMDMTNAVSRDFKEIYKEFDSNGEVLSGVQNLKNKPKPNTKVLAKLRDSLTCKGKLCFRDVMGESQM